MIEPDTPDWDADGPHRFQATVRTAAGGEEIADSISVSVVVEILGPLGEDSHDILTAQKTQGDGTVFLADASALGPFFPNQQIRFWWGAETAQEDGNLLELEKTDPQIFQVNSDGCNQTAEVYLRTMHAAIVDRFDGITTVSGLQAEDYLLNNHGWPSIDGIGVSFVHPNPVFDVNNPELLFFLPAEGANITNTSGPDQPYRFAGWAYGNFSFDPDGPRPVLGCFPHHEWFLHEAGWHTLDGGMLLDPTPGNAADPPPVSLPTALSIGATPERYHPRIWDLHFWVNREAMEETGDTSVAPRVSIFNTDSSGGLIPSGGLPAATGPASDDFPEGQCAFFYVEIGCDF